MDEWRRYFAVNGVGAALNLGIFLMLTYRDFARMIVHLFFRGSAPAVEIVTNAPPAEAVPAK